jgi:hypothetical protein
MNEEQQQPQQAVMQLPQWYIDRLIVKKLKFEIAPFSRMVNDSLHQYAKEIGKIKNMDNVRWRKVSITISFLFIQYTYSNIVRVRSAQIFIVLITS